MIEYKLDTFYRTAKEIITHQKASRECDRINSLIVINSKFDIGKDYVQAVDRNPYLFSRDNSELVYPLMVISKNFSTFTETRSCTILEVGVIDQYKEGCDDCDACGKRGIDQIKMDTESLLIKQINEFASIKLYKTEPGGVFKFSVQGLIDQYITENVITSARIVNPQSALLHKLFKSENATKRSLPYVNKTKMLYGSFMIVSICEICSDGTIQYKIKNIQANEDCCP